MAQTQVRAGHLCAQVLYDWPSADEIEAKFRGVGERSKVATGREVIQTSLSVFCLENH